MIHATSAALMLTAAVCPALPAQNRVAEWVVGPRPITVVGGSNAGHGADLVGVSSAHRLPNGNVAVANGDPLDVRLFDASGRLLRTIGREGAGPGEFQGQVMVLAAGRDSLLTYTSGNARWEWFSPSGKLLRESKAATAPSPLDLVLYRHVFATRGRDTPFACVRALADRLPDQGNGPFTEVVPDRDGRFWVYRGGAPVWSVYTVTGRPLARVPLPPHTRLLDVVPGAVVLLARDADDVERVEVWPVAMPPASAVADPCYHAAPDADRSPTGVATARLKTDVRNLLEFAKRYAATNHRYPGDLEQLHYQLEHGVRGLVLLAGTEDWAVELEDQTAHLACILNVGEKALPGWRSGAVACTTAPANTSP